MNERNWKEYNEHPVQRGEILIAPKCLSGWEKELRKMNKGKNGRPFRYPNSLMLFLGTLRALFSIPFRQLEGVVLSLGLEVQALELFNKARVENHGHDGITRPGMRVV